MPQNGIRMEGIEAIVKGLRSNVNLQVLDLQDNTATEKGSRAIAASLPL
jgi:Ran GTPase-activating protein 1